MKHPRAKGNKAVHKAMVELQGQGCIVSRVEATNKWAKERDCFGLFDLVVLKREGPVRFIQITSNRPHTHKLYDAFAEQYQNVAIEQWVWVDRKGFKKFIY